MHSPKRRAWCDGRERRAAAAVAEVSSVGHDGVAPPGLDGGEADGAVPGELQAEVDEDDRDRDARVQSRGENIWSRVCRSGASEQTRREVHSQLYFVHHEKCLRRMR